MFREEIHQRRILYRFHAVTDAFRAQFANSLPDAFRTGGFTGVHRNVPARVTRAVEVGQEQTAREAQFITGKVKRGDPIAVRQQRFQFLQAGGFAEGPAHDADQLRLYAKGFAAFLHAGNNGFHHASNRQLMRHCHVTRRKTQFYVVQAIACGVFDIFKRDAATGVEGS